MILCCGEALIDMIPRRAEGGEAAFVPHSGGSVFNTAIALGRLGVQTGMLTGLSTDLFGRQLETALRASQVDTSLVISSGRPTTLAFVELTDGHASYTFYDENSAGRMMSADELPALPADVNSLYFGGISLCNPPAADAFSALAKREAGNCAIMLDPNIRPGFIDDIDAFRARLDTMIEIAQVVKVSDEDLNWLYPGPESLQAKIELVLAKGPSIVVLTRGGAGATAYLEKGRNVTVSAARTEVVDTVGAGDTFNAGFLAKASELGLLTPDGLTTITDETLEECLGFAARVAAVTVSRAGANPPWLHELTE